jgi:amphi-Trp domain-containing protein
MTDLKFEQKRSLSRLEAADQLEVFAAALRQGGDAELELGSAALSLRIPDDLRSEVELEVGDGEIELEIELKWPITPIRTLPTSQTEAETPTAPSRRRSATARPKRSGTGAGRSTSAKRAPAKTS